MMRLLVSGATTTLEELAPAWPNHLGRLLTPRARNDPDRIALPWAADNSAYSAWDEAAFLRLVNRVAGKPDCLFLAVPDVVGNAWETLELYRRWQPRLAEARLPLALVAQDGVEALPIPWASVQAWFIGGTDGWKLSPASQELAQTALRLGKHLHMGRVNSFTRLAAAHAWGCHSCDGSGMSRFSRTWLPRFLAYLRYLDNAPLLPEAC